eukprot:11592052-Heterocapsa_arctica.AAC.1
MLKELDQKSPSDAGKLWNILAGGTWPQIKTAEVDTEATTLCLCCKENHEDEIHRWYICGCHKSLRKDFEYVRLQAVKEISDRRQTHPFTKTPRREHL